MQNQLWKQLDRLQVQDNSQDEGIQDYHPGGYHPVHIGQTLFKRYLIIKKLGWGHFSTVWLCKDYKHENYVAIKIQKSAPHYMQAAFDQVQILQRVGQKQPHPQVVGILHSFVHKTMYGNHFCMVFQILSCNLLDVIKKFKFQGIPIQQVRQITRQCLQGLKYLHQECRVIHTDLKPQNVMLGLTSLQATQLIQTSKLQRDFKERRNVEEVRGWMGDLGNGCWQHHHFSTQIQTRQYRSPQVLIGCHYSFSADIWSLGCMVFELITGDLLFQPRKGENWSKNEDHIAQIIQLLGSWSQPFAMRGTKSKHYFTKNGTMKKINKLQSISLKNILIQKYKIKVKDSQQLANFLQFVLVPQPQNRPTAKQCLQHKWIKQKGNWGDCCKMNDEQCQQLQQLIQCESILAYSKMTFQADNEDNDIEDDIQENKNKKRLTDIKFIDRSFTDLGYVGFNQGISLEDLDTQPNWQFA